jgi:hypothetical protein
MAVTLRDRHHARVDQAKSEIGVLVVDRGCSAQQAGTEEHEGVLPGGDCPEEGSAGRAAETRSRELVDLDENGVGDEKLAAERPDERRRESMCRVAPVEGCDERSRVRDDSQRASRMSRRYSSARMLRSGGPSPDPT